MDSASRRELQVNPDLCMGSGQCIWYAPNTFDQDATATAFVTNQHGDTEDKIAEAIASCPARAISLVPVEP
jgi:ferredoxin